MKRALVVGINCYRNEKLANLRTPANDANAVAQRLREIGFDDIRGLPSASSQEGWQVDPEPEENLRHDELEAAIDWLFAIDDNSNIPEIALLFFAGHGLRQVKGRLTQGFLATSRANPTAASTEKWGVSLFYLRQILEHSPVKQQIVILDCCHSGELFNYKEASLEADPGKSEIVTRCLISACGAPELAYESHTAEHSVFTEALLQGFQQRGVVSTVSLSLYLENALKPRKQTPICINRNGEIILIDPEVEPIKHQEIVEGPCPYKGLAAFQEEDAPYFFGRNKLTQQLVNPIHDSRFLAVLGISGSGKSSVVRAGLIPELKKGSTFSETRKWKIYEPFKPGDDPLESLARVLVDENLSMEQVNAELAQGAPGLQRLISQINAPGVVLVVDQFEQIFTQCQSHPKRQQFFDCLFAAIQTPHPTPHTPHPTPLSPHPSPHIIITMRADFLGKCAEYPQLAKLIETNNKIVGQMEEAELREAIAKPGKTFNWEIPETLQNRMIADVQKSPGSLPLLQYVLTELWKWRGQRLTLDTYEKMGGVQKALHKHADRVYQSLSPQQQTIAKSIFLELTQLVGTEPTSRQVRKSRLLGLPPDPEQVETVLNELVDEKARLLAIGKLSATQKNADDIEVVEVIHESLISNWERLKQWVEENPDIKRQRDEIQAKAQEWEDKGKRRDGLLRGLDLVEAEAFVRRYGDDFPLSAPAPEFLRKSIWQRRITRIVSIGTVATVLTVVTGLWLNAQRQATIASLGEKAARAENLLSSTEALDGLLLAIQATGESQNKLGQVLSSVQDILLTGIQIAREQNRVPVPGSVSTDRVPVPGSVAISTDGKTIVSGSRDGILRLWNLQGQQIYVLRGHEASVTSVAISPDGQYIVSGSDDNTLRLWDMGGKAIGLPLKGHRKRISGVAISPNGQYIVSGSDDNTLRLWNRWGKPIGKPFQMGKKSYRSYSITSVAFSPDGEYIVSGSVDGTVRLWNLQGQLIGKPIKAHKMPVTTVAVRPNEIIVSGSSDISDGQRFGNSIVDNRVRQWDRNGQMVNDFRYDWGFNDVAISSDGETIVSGSLDGTVQLWTPEGRSIDETLRGHKGSVGDIAISPNGEYIVSSDNKTVRLWNLQNVGITTLREHKNSVTTVAISPDGETIVSGSDDNTVRLWNRQGEIIHVLRGHQDSVEAVAISPDGGTIVSGSNDKTVRLWNRQGQVLAVLSGHQNNVIDVAISPDGQTIVSYSTDDMRLWNRHGEPIEKPWNLQGNYRLLGFSFDGRIFAAKNENDYIRLFNLKGETIGQPFQIVHHDSSITSVAFSPDGKYIVSGSTDGTVRLSNLRGELIGSPLRHNDGVEPGNTVTSVAFSPDGEYIVSSSLNGTVRLWNLQGKQIGKPFRGHTKGILVVAFSPDGDYIVSGGKDNTLRLWSVGWKNWLHTGCNQLQYHPVLVAPETDVARDAGETCQKYAWNQTESAQFLVRQGKALARAGDMEAAVAKFKQAKKLDTTLDLEPETEVKSIAASLLVEDGKDLAYQGKYNEALAKFQAALTLDPTLDLETEAEAKRIVVPILVEKAEEQVKDKQYKEALETYTNAQTIDPTLEIYADNWVEICWYGSLHGEAAAILEACEKAVTLKPITIGIRGMAKVIAGDKDGAIKDFQAYLEFINHEEVNREELILTKRLFLLFPPASCLLPQNSNLWFKRKIEMLPVNRLVQGYIDALRAGEIPFTDAEIEKKCLLGE